MRVSVPPFTQVHHQVHGHVPDTAVGVPVAQVAVGRAYELKATLQLASTLLLAVQAFPSVLVPPFGLLHHQVHGHVPDTTVPVPERQVDEGSE